MLTSKKIVDEIKVTESKPPLIKEQCVVYEYKCDLCETVVVFANTSDIQTKGLELSVAHFARNDHDYGDSRLWNREEKTTVLQSCVMQIM